MLELDGEHECPHCGNRRDDKIPFTPFLEPIAWPVQCYKCTKKFWIKGEVPCEVEVNSYKREPK